MLNRKKIIVTIVLLLIITMNIMKVVEIRPDVNVNIALSDIVLPFFIVYIGLIVLKEKRLDSVKYIQWIILVPMWLVFTNIFAATFKGIATTTNIKVLSEWIKTFVCILYFYVGYNTLKIIKVTTLLRVYSFGYSLFLVYGFITIILNSVGVKLLLLHNKVGSYFLGTYHDPNQAATYMIISFYLMIYLYNCEEVKWVKYCTFFLAIISIPGIILTDSRGGIIALTVSLVFYSLIVYHKRIAELFVFLQLSFLALICGMLFDSSINSGKFASNLFRSLANFDSALTTRNDLSLTAWNMGLDNLLLGVGRGNYIVNSQQYFDKLDLVYVDNIPHNTFLGLFAETGLIGLVLYFIPVILIIVHVLKKRKHIVNHWHGYKPFIASLVALSIGIGIQSYVLNLENRRTIWFIGGIILYCFENSEILSELSIVRQMNQMKNHRKLLGLNIGLLFMSILLYSYTMNQVAVIKEEHISTNTVIIDLPIKETLVSEDFEVEFYLHANQPDLNEQPMVKISIIEEEVSGDKHILSSYVYQKTKGMCRLMFNKEFIDSTVYMEVQKVSKDLEFYTISEKRLITKDWVLQLDNYYYLRNESNQNYALQRNWVNKEGIAEEEYQPLLSELNTINFDNKFVIKRCDIINMGNNVMVDITVESLISTENEYELWLYGKAANLHDTDEIYFLTNKEYYKAVTENNSISWETGKCYNMRFEMPRDCGWHQLFAGFKYKDQDGMIHLTNTENNEISVELGWFNASDLNY